MEKKKLVHSVTVPKLYRDVAKVIKNVVESGAGLKDCIYGKDDKFNRNKQRAFALANKILEKYQKIEHIIRDTEILIKEPALNPWLARVLIHEIAWRKDFNHESKPMQVVSLYKSQINDALSTYKEELNPPSTKKVTKPRYARVNTNNMSVAEVIDYLRNEGMVLIPSYFSTYSDYLNTVATLSGNYFVIDFHVKELLVFSPDTFLITHKLYKNHTLILQDKASCFAPFLLKPKKGSAVLDMCAAPGMKASYLANQVGLNGRVYAVELNQRRYLTLSTLMNQMGMKNVKCIHKSAHEITGDELSDVEYILVDPSCSGSGITNRTEFEMSKPNRLQSLANFQVNILTHALTKFPNVERVVYSTCSINPEENEEVICSVINNIKKFKLVNLQEKLKPNWLHFGSDKYGEIGTSCLYTNPEIDYTNGFFIAMFEKISKKQKRESMTASYENEQNTEYVEEINIKKESKNQVNEENEEEKKVNIKTFEKISKKRKRESMATSYESEKNTEYVKEVNIKKEKESIDAVNEENEEKEANTTSNMKYSEYKDKKKSKKKKYDK